VRGRESINSLVLSRELHGGHVMLVIQKFDLHGRRQISTLQEIADVLLSYSVRHVAEMQTIRTCEGFQRLVAVAVILRHGHKFFCEILSRLSWWYAGALGLLYLKLLTV